MRFHCPLILIARLGTGGKARDLRHALNNYNTNCPGNENGSNATSEQANKESITTTATEKNLMETKIRVASNLSKKIRNSDS